MTVFVESHGVQFGLHPLGRLDAYYNSGKIYTQRKDVLRVKALLQELVPYEEYWRILSLFVHGECTKARFDETMNLYLATNRARILHNEFVRSIIFNAHFSTVPPPGVALPVRPVPDEIGLHRNSRPSAKIQPFSTFSATDLGHLPSGKQLAHRIAILLDGRTMKMDDTAVQMLSTKMRQYVSALLRRSTELIVRECPRMAVVNSAHIEHALRTNLGFASVISPALFSKFAVA
jgi:hypothetical protein